MNDNNAKTMYETVPAAAELNKVPGFDPLKFLRRTKDTLKLDLPYQKLWFRMAHPNGRMRLTALRITEQMAIFEAKVFLDRSDAEPFSIILIHSLHRQLGPCVHQAPVRSHQHGVGPGGKHKVIQQLAAARRSRLCQFPHQGIHLSGKVIIYYGGIGAGGGPGDKAEGDRPGRE